MSQIDDGWSLESAPTETASTRELTERGRSRLELIREALRILDGDAPEELELEGEGWSLLDPAAVAAAEPVVAAEEPTDSRPVEEETEGAEPVSLGSLMVAMRGALDDALSDGWLLSQDEDSLTLTSEEEAFFAAGEQLAQTSAPPEVEYADEPSRWKRLLRKTA